MPDNILFFAISSMIVASFLILLQMFGEIGGGSNPPPYIYIFIILS